MSQPKKSNGVSPTAGAEGFQTRAAFHSHRSPWSAQPVLARIATILTTISFISFFPLVIWRSKIILMIASALTWIAMTYVGAMSLFGPQSTVDAIMWQGRQDYSETSRELYGRIFGAILLGFITFAAYEIFHGGIHAAYNNFGR